MLPRRKTLRKLSPCSGISWRHSPFALHPAQSFLEVKLQLGRLQQVGIGIDLTSIHWCWFSRPQALPGTKVRRTDVTTWDNKLLGWIWTGKYFVLVGRVQHFHHQFNQGSIGFQILRMVSSMDLVLDNPTSCGTYDNYQRWRTPG